MDTGDRGFFFRLFDNDARDKGLRIVKDANSPKELLNASIEHFNNNVLSLGALTVLDYFNDNDIYEGLRDLEGFDPVLFKATFLFELSHIKDDESEIPEIVEDISNFWKTANHADKDQLHLMFTADTKRTKYQPFKMMSRFVTRSMMDVGIKKEIEKRRNEIEDENKNKTIDPIEESIDGDKRKWKIFIGNHELKTNDDQDAVLDTQLILDLKKIFPSPIIDELDARFPVDGKFEDIHPLIEKIIYERKNKIIPPAEELLSGLKRKNNIIKNYVDFLDLNDKPEEKLLQEAVEKIDRLRNIESRIFKRDIYILEKQEWYSVLLLTSETEVNTFYRRIFTGDIHAPKHIELNIEDRQLIIEALKEEEEEHLKNLKAEKRDRNIIEVFGKW